ncbi:histidine phosphatase family protein [Treponema pedis]|uniref:Histidine phosphatase family protein n=1 Tax=Treponema pedis TaxID=409322 RepID=A0A7S7AXG9_9SPIR|nr:histidine phosphatase family protein [Treponema pedis]QOW61611.1 histidine phosphatase family protein [Treponema pedis]
MKLFITRHGESDWNVKELACGISEAELTDKGRSQAQALASDIAANQNTYNIKTIYVSPLKRAKETSSYIEKALGVKAITNELLKEMNFGTFEGANWKNSPVEEILKQPFMRFPKGESLADVAHRAYSVIEEILKKHKDTKEGILLVCHGIMTAMLCTYFKSFTQNEFEVLEIENCKLLEFNL